MVCSNCLKNLGLRIEAEKIGAQNNTPCERCSSKDGFKLNITSIQKLIIRFFQFGSIDSSYQLPVYVLSINSSKEILPFNGDIATDLRLLNEESGYNVDYHGPPLRDLGYTEISSRIEDVHNETKEKIDLILDELLSKFTRKTLEKDFQVFRIRKNLINPNNDKEFDSPPKDLIVENRLNDSETSIFYCSNDINTCIHEVKATVYDDLYLATFRLLKPLNILSLLEYKSGISFEDLNDHISFISYLFRTDLDYKTCQLLAKRAKNLGYDGLEYYSFFSKVSADRISNIALFGFPIRDNILKLESINKIRFERIEYKLNFGPVE